MHPNRISIRCNALCKLSAPENRPTIPCIKYEYDKWLLDVDRTIQVVNPQNRFRWSQWQNPAGQSKPYGCRTNVTVTVYTVGKRNTWYWTRARYTDTHCSVLDVSGFIEPAIVPRQWAQYVGTRNVSLSHSARAEEEENDANNDRINQIYFPQNNANTFAWCATHIIFLLRCGRMRIGVADIKYIYIYIRRASKRMIRA